MRLLWQVGPLSRSQLHQITGIRPNTVGEDVDILLKGGVLEETEAQSTGPGRPRVPVRICNHQRHVLGLAIDHRWVSLARMTLTGDVVQEHHLPTDSACENQVQQAAALLAQNMDERVFAIGLSTTGLIDPRARRLLFNLATVTTHQTDVDLTPLDEVAGDRPVILGNSMHAIAAQWLLRQSEPPRDDTLLISMADGLMAGSLLINAVPNRGSVCSANEVGHMRLPVETDCCYCGHTGCLERIFSTAQLARLEGTALAQTPTLIERIARYENEQQDPSLFAVTELVSIGVANAVNLVRPCDLVLAGEFMDGACWRDELIRQVQARVLTPLAQRLRLDIWTRRELQQATSAGWLALASIYCPGWDAMEPG